MHYASRQFGAFWRAGPDEARPAPPCELAPGYVMLASDEASYVSGTVVGVAGGKPII